MNKPIVSQPRVGVVPHTAPANFELDEIEWKENDFPVHPDSIPFKNTMKSIIEELEILNQANNNV